MVVMQGRVRQVGLPEEIYLEPVDSEGTGRGAGGRLCLTLVDLAGSEWARDQVTLPRSFRRHAARPACVRATLAKASSRPPTPSGQRCCQPLTSRRFRCVLVVYAIDDDAIAVLVATVNIV